MLAFATLFNSCEKETLRLFDKRPSVYFFWMENQNEYNKRQGFESVKFNYMPRSVNVDTLLIPVMVLGRQADYDRKFGIEVNEPRTSAKHGTHYEILHDLSYIPANSSMGYATILAKRGQTNEDKEEVRLSLRLVENDILFTDFDSIMNNSTQRRMRNVIEFDVLISDVALTKPAVWLPPYDRFTIPAWGAFSFVKYELILRDEIGGMEACFWDLACPGPNGWMFRYENLDPVAAKLRHYLWEQYCAGDIDALYDENGNMMDDVRGLAEAMKDCSDYQPKK
jgi:hypothetical protein